MNSLTESGQQLTTSEGKQTQKERGYFGDSQLAPFVGMIRIRFKGLL